VRVLRDVEHPRVHGQPGFLPGEALGAQKMTSVRSVPLNTNKVLICRKIDLA